MPGVPSAAEYVGCTAPLVAAKKGRVVVVEKLLPTTWRISRALAACLARDVCWSLVEALW